MLANHLGIQISLVFHAFLDESSYRSKIRKYTADDISTHWTFYIFVFPVSFPYGFIITFEGQSPRGFLRIVVHHNKFLLPVYHKISSFYSHFPVFIPPPHPHLFADLPKDIPPYSPAHYRSYRPTRTAHA